MKKIIYRLLCAYSILLCSCSTKVSSSSSTSYDEPISAELVRNHEDRPYSKQYFFTNDYYRGHYDFILHYQSGNQTIINPTSVSWKSSNSDIFTVDSVGTIIPKNDGQATLKARYRDFILEEEINVRTIARQVEKNSNADEYRVGNKYYFPIKTVPTNASLEINISNPDVIKMTDIYNLFEVVSTGTTHVSISLFIDESGNKTTLEYDFNTMSKYSPTFLFNNSIATRGEIEIPRYKYKNLDFTSWGIKAKSYDGNDITSLIEYDSGDYSLNEVGEYDCRLKVIDPNYPKSCAYFYLNMVVTEVEERKDFSPIDGLDFENTKATFHANNPGSNVLDYIDFSVEVTLNERYTKCEGTVTWFLYFYIAGYSGVDNTHDHRENPITIKQEIDFSTPRTLTMFYRYDPIDSINGSTFSDCYSVGAFNGYCYYYLDYSPS